VNANATLQIDSDDSMTGIKLVNLHEFTQGFCEPPLQAFPRCLPLQSIVIGKINSMTDQISEELWTQVQKKLDDILANSCPDKIKKKKRKFKSWLGAEKKKNEYIGKIIQARKDVVVECQQRQEVMHSSKDLATAIFFPDCIMMGRCWKCQCLYQYTMHRKAQDDELSDQCFGLPHPSRGFKGYPACTCAEDLAHSFCKAVNAQKGASAA
jgi:hypothetical protein